MNLAEVAALNTDAFHEPSVRLVVDCLPLLIWLCTDAGVCDFINRKGLEFTGLPGSQTTHRWIDLVPADDRERFAGQWQAAVQSGSTWHAEARLRRHDGGYQWFALQAVPLPGGGKWIFSASDLEEAADNCHLQVASHQELRSVFDEAPIAISLEDWRGVVNALKELRATGIQDLRAYVDSHPEFVDQMIDTTIMVDTNKVSLALFRAEHRAQLVGRPMRWLFDTPDARQRFIEVLLLFGSDSPRQPVVLEMDLCAFNGTPIRVLSHALERQAGIEPGMVLVSRFDVTEFRRADQQLADQRILLDRMGSLAKVGGWVYDVEASRGSWTRELSTIHGLDPRETIGLEESLSAFAEAERSLVRNAMQRAIKYGESYDMEVPLVTPGNEHKWVRARAMPIVRNGKTVRIEGALQDITDRKLAELEVTKLNATLEQQVKERTEQLEQARRNLQNILDALPTMVAYWDCNLHLQFTNRAYQQIMGKTAEELKGRHLTELIDVAIRAERLHYVQLALRGEPQHFESITTRSRTGASTGRAEVHYLPDIVDGEVRGVYVMVMDVTSQYQAADALRAANQELEAFAYAVAHDLRAPLRAMNGFSTALLEDCGPRLDEEAKLFATEINRASCRMGDLLDGLLALSRATQGDMRFDRVDISALACSLANELRQQEPQRQVSWQIAPDMYANGDARMLEAALRNLLANAWKYTSRTALAEIRVDTLERDSAWFFRVSDNGAGFDMAHAERLFKPFQRLHRQDEFAGIGIGLATVKRIVKRHGGEISAEASPGGGASFFFSLSGPIKEQSS